MRLDRIVACGALFALASACAGDGGATRPDDDVQPTPTPSGDILTAAEAGALFNDAVGLALAGAPGATVTHGEDAVILGGTVILGGGTVSFDTLSLATKPFAPSGAATVESEGHTAALAFTGSVDGTAVVDGAAAGSVTAEFPMTAEFASGAADWAMDFALSPGSSFANPCPNLTLTDNGGGSFTIDGDCAIGGATVDFDMVTVDLANMAITGSIALDDGNGNTALIEFNGATFDVTVNGTLVVDDEPIFAFLGP